MVLKTTLKNVGLGVVLMAHLMFLIVLLPVMQLSLMLTNDDKSVTQLTKQGTGKDGDDDSSTYHAKRKLARYLLYVLPVVSVVLTRPSSELLVSF